MFALLMIVKDEEKTIEKTLQSCKNFCDIYIIQDTGSTDNTKKIVSEWCEKNHKRLELFNESFVDFSHNRNKLLEETEKMKDVTFCLLLDSNEEIYHFETISEIVSQHFHMNGFLIPLRLDLKNTSTTFYNIKLIRNNCGWRYKNPIHEYLYNANPNLGKLEAGPFIYQNRDVDVEKSKKRYVRDREILEKSEQTPRNIFYLAQTYHSLGEFENAKEYFLKRANIDDGYKEEIYESWYRLGILTNDMSYYLKAYEVFERVEPIYKICEVLFSMKEYEKCYTLLEKACKMGYPTGYTLFLDNKIYEEKRYMMMILLCRELKKPEKGLEMIKKLGKRDKRIDAYEKEFTEHMT